MVRPPPNVSSGGPYVARRRNAIAPNSAEARLCALAALEWRAQQMQGRNTGEFFSRKRTLFLMNIAASYCMHTSASPTAMSFAMPTGRCLQYAGEYAACGACSTTNGQHSRRRNKK
eukprot:TRINITY_DN4607_c1_g2_i2.p1 TRINITY_DN4607_c1_g2~~TRINITY_DN4607_c1_g2_i2.p1  ORF type:complete len:116 (+),score=10.33 TRINITY_DN4607_c1_g2_i2:204-551(+)